jgi:hypothetical protein
MEFCQFEHVLTFDRMQRAKKRLGLKNIATTCAAPECHQARMDSKRQLM